MATTEVDTFVRKFHQLWKAGLTAHLDLDTHAGNAWVGLRVQLGHVPGPLHQQVHPHQVRKVSPSRLRRRERRLAARENVSSVNNTAAATVEVVTPSSEEEHANIVVENTADKATTEKDKQNEESTEKADQSKKETLAENASAVFECPICDFESTWENGLSVHMGRMHGSIEQLDGQAEINEIDKKYENTEHYWKKGRLGVTYLTFLDANYVIDNSELSEEDKKTEKEKILEARKAAFGNSFQNFPPWDKKPP